MSMGRGELSFTFASSPTERAAAEREGTRFGLIGRMSRFTSFLFVGACVVLATIGIWSRGSLSGIDGALPLLFLGALWRWGIPVLSRRFDDWRIRLEGTGGPALEIRSLTPEGFYVSTKDGAHLYRWGAVTEVVETDEFFLLFPGHLVPPHYIPKHAVPVSAEEPLRALLADVFEGRSDKLKLLPWAT